MTFRAQGFTADACSGVLRVGFFGDWLVDYFFTAMPNCLIKAQNKSSPIRVHSLAVVVDEAAIYVTRYTRVSTVRNGIRVDRGY